MTWNPTARAKSLEKPSRLSHGQFGDWGNSALELRQFALRDQSFFAKMRQNAPEAYQITGYGTLWWKVPPKPKRPHKRETLEEARAIEQS